MVSNLENDKQKPEMVGERCGQGMDVGGLRGNFALRVCGMAELSDP